MKAEVKNGKLILTVDLAKDPQPSKSGKTLVVASSGGFKDLEVKHPDTGKPIKGSYNFTVPKE